MKDTRQEPNLLAQGIAMQSPFIIVCMCARPLMTFAPSPNHRNGYSYTSLHIPLKLGRKVGSERRAVGAVLAAERAAFRNPKTLIPCSLAFWVPVKKIGRGISGNFPVIHA